MTPVHRDDLATAPPTHNPPQHFVMLLGKPKMEGYLECRENICEIITKAFKVTARQLSP